MGRESIKLARDAQEPLLIAYAMQHLAIIGAGGGHERDAARLLGYVDEVIRKAEFQREPTEKWSMERLLLALREQLKDDEIATLCAAGAAWSEDQAVAAALQM